MPQLFRLFWLRETGCDTGRPLRAAELEPEIRQRVCDLAALARSRRNAGDIDLRLPYMDRLEWPKRGKILEALVLERSGDVISAVLSPAAALRDTAATLALTDPAWLAAPSAAHPDRLAVWQGVSMRLQKCFRTWIPELYFQDIAQFGDRERAHPMLVYQVAHLYRGRCSGEFTYNFHDYPDCGLTLAWALKMTGLPLQRVLAGVESRLRDAGMPELARRYSPIWYQDLVVGVRKKPKLFLDLLQAESKFIDALMDLGLNRTPSGVQIFFKAANRALRKVYGVGGCQGPHAQGMDLRSLGIMALAQATEQLASPPQTVTS